MLDFQVVFPSELIELNGVQSLPGPTPRLGVYGKDFRTIDEVQVNGEPSPLVNVVSETYLVVDVPTGVYPPYTVQVLSHNLTISPESLVRLKIGRTPSKVRGILRLMQLFLKVLLTTPGTDIFSKRLGGNALKNLGQSNTPSSVTSDFVLAVKTTVQQILVIQSGDMSIPRDERLLSAKVVSNHFNRQAQSLLVSIELLSHAGDAATANVMV